MASVLERARVEAPTRVDRGSRRRALLVVAMLAAGGGAWLVGDPTARLAADPELAWLLRGMAALKAVFVLVATAVIGWRLGAPLASWLSRGYIAAIAVMTGTAVMVWQLSHLSVTSFAFHGALIALFVLAWCESRVRKTPSA